MDLELKNKVILVTGSSQGIGFAIAKRLYDEGASLILNGKNQTKLKKAAEKIGDRVDFVVADVTDQQQCKKIIEQIQMQFGRLDILVCNVGSGASVKPGAETADEWQRMMKINLSSTTNMVEAAKGLLGVSKGSIVCISSICGHEVISGAPVTYSAAKAALNAYIKGIARPLGEQGIRINAVSPGNILFDGSVWEKKLTEDESKVKEMLNKEVALKRLGKVSEIADFVAFLVSPKAAFSTGAVYVIDGGQVRHG